MMQLVEEKTSPALIKVIGVGGGGMNAVNRMIDANLRGVEFIVINTDEQVLKKSRAEHKIAIGQKTTRGMGAGGDPEIGLRAAQEDRDRILQVLKGADMVFVTAGMGGGTGTGAAPIIADVAKELKALTVAVVTVPFEVEGKRRRELALKGLSNLRDRVDTLITIKNDSIFKVIEQNTPVDVAFRIVDEVLLGAVRGISDLVNEEGPHQRGLRRRARCYERNRRCNHGLRRRHGRRPCGPGSQSSHQ
jgi:cell division protein FtsZ